MRKEVLADVDGFDVCVTTYEYVKVPEMQRALATRITWRVVVLDEGHKLKNDLSGVSAAMRKVHAQSILMLTGTPLQNNMRELWALLNFLYPKVFTDVDPFANSFELSGSEITVSASRLLTAVPCHANPSHNGTCSPSNILCSDRPRRAERCGITRAAAHAAANENGGGEAPA